MSYLRDLNYNDMNLNFNVALKDGKGKDTPQKLSDILSEFLLTENKGNARKLYAWGVLLAAGNPLSIDNVDRKTLVELIENSERIVALVKGQLLEILDDAKEG